MGYFIKDIAKETRTPAKVSLSGNPNFIQFENLNDTSGNKPVDVTFQVLGWGITPEDNSFTFTDHEGKEHKFTATNNPAEAGGSVFYLDPDTEKLRNNIIHSIMSDEFFGKNYYISVYNGESGALYYFRMVSAAIDTLYDFTYGYSYRGGIRFYDGSSRCVIAEDTISEGNEDVEIHLDFFRDTKAFLGEDKTITGTYVNTLTKAYFGNPVWFNTNILNSGYSNKFLRTKNWCDAGTLNSYRFVGKRAKKIIMIGEEGKNEEKIETDIFYYSDVLYSLNGYKRTLEENDLSPYIYDTVEKNLVKPLTTQPELFHIKGQKQYFNFILSDRQRNVDLDEEYNFGINYKLFTQSGSKIANVLAHEVPRKSFNTVNTIRLDIEGAMAGMSNVGKVEVVLARNGEIVSEPLVYTILPECLYKVHDFAFLNSLGGWSSFNFAGTEETDFKTNANTFFSTQTPGFDTSSSIESVYNKEVKESFVVRTMPVTKEVADWLKELSASKAVYELSTKRYVVVDELAIKPNSKDDLFILEMKYHYSDSYNANIA